MSTTPSAGPPNAGSTQPPGSGQPPAAQPFTPSEPLAASVPAASAPAQAPGAVTQSATGTSTGLDPKVAGLLTYLFGWVSGLILFLVEKEHREVRFHAAQAMLLSFGLIAVYIGLSVVTMVLSMIPFIGLLALLGYMAVGLGGFVLWIYLLVQGYNLNHFKLPVIGNIAEEWAAK